MNKSSAEKILWALALFSLIIIMFYNYYFYESFAFIIHYTLPPNVSETQPPQVLTPSQAEQYIEEKENEPPQSKEEQWVQTLTSVQFPLDINIATYDQLRFIPKVGDVTAQRILQYRDVIGGYTNIQQLSDIKGIGGKTYQHISAYLIVRDENDKWDGTPATSTEE